MAGVTLSFDNQTAADEGNANFNSIFSQLLSVGTDTTVPSLFGFIHYTCVKQVYKIDIVYNAIGTRYFVNLSHRAINLIGQK